MDENNRMHFRILYDVNERPDFDVSGNKYAVFDLSEQGLRFECKNDGKVVVGLVMSGTIIFKDKTKIMVVGKIIRKSKDGKFAMVELSQGIPLAKMMDESRSQLKRRAQVK